MSKLGIAMTILTFILIVLAFWFVGCSDKGTNVNCHYNEETDEYVCNDSTKFELI